TRLPIDAGNGRLIDHHERGQAWADRDRKVRRGDLLQVEFDHHVLSDLPAFGGSILQAIETPLHVGDATFETCGQCLISKGRTDYGGDDLGQIGQTLDRIGESLLINVGVCGPDAVTNGKIGEGSKLQIHNDTPVAYKIYVIINII